MQKFDVQILAQNLHALTEVYEKKPVSAKALEVWFDTLKEFPTERIMGLLIHWPKQHTKFPTPAEVWRSCNETVIDEREAKAELERAENLRQPFIRSERGAEFLAQMKAILSRPKRRPVEHWRWVLENAPRDSIGEQYARQALAKLDPQSLREREPRQDDEELAA